MRIHGDGALADDIRAFGMNKEMGGLARQFVLGEVQTADGLPLKGHTASPRTALDMLARIQKHTAHIGTRTFNGTRKTTRSNWTSSTP